MRHQRAGINTGMSSDDESDAFVGALGEKVLAGIARSVDGARADLTLYRERFPQWVAEHSERGLANWIHDRLWPHLVAELDGLPSVAFSDKGVLREFRVERRFLFRAKRHAAGDKISSYPTPAALAFWSQSGASLLPEFGEVRLAVGYRWNPDVREIDEAVISLRNSMDKPVWVITVDVQADTGAVELRPVTGDEPALPVVELLEPEDDQATGTDDEDESE